MPLLAAIFCVIGSMGRRSWDVRYGVDSGSFVADAAASRL